MSWITIIWSAIAAICLTLAGVHTFVWTKSRDSWANLFFSVAATAATVTAVFELTLMRADTPAQLGELLRWFHVPTGVLVIALTWFVSFYLQACRLWLAWPVSGIKRQTVLALPGSLR